MARQHAEQRWRAQGARIGEEARPHKVGGDPATVRRSSRGQPVDLLESTKGKSLSATVEGILKEAQTPLPRATEVKRNPVGKMPTKPR